MVDKCEVDLCVLMFLMVIGEKVVMWVFDWGKVMFSLDKLGML